MHELLVSLGSFFKHVSSRDRVLSCPWKPKRETGHRQLHKSLWWNINGKTICSHSKSCRHRLKFHWNVWAVVLWLIIIFLFLMMETWGGISSSILSVIFTDKFYKLLKSLHLIGWEQICQWKTLTKCLMKCPHYKICQWKTLTKRLMKCPPESHWCNLPRPIPIRL